MDFFLCNFAFVTVFPFSNSKLRSDWPIYYLALEARRYLLSTHTNNWVKDLTYQAVLLLVCSYKLFRTSTLKMNLKVIVSVTLTLLQIDMIRQLLFA